MAIGTAVQRGSMVYIYDERGHQTGVVSGDLQGYTSGTVSVQRGTMICTYDQRGHQLAVTSAGSSRRTSSSSGSGSGNSPSPNPLLFAVLILAVVIGSATGLIKPSTHPDANQQQQGQTPQPAPPEQPAPESPSEPAAAEPAVLWGAFAVSPSTGASGWSKGYGSESEAQQAAVRSCGQDDCNAFGFTAGAAALVESDSRWYHESGRSSEEEAGSMSLQQCQNQEPAGNCRMVASFSF